MLKVTPKTQHMQDPSRLKNRQQGILWTARKARMKEQKKKKLKKSHLLIITKNFFGCFAIKHIFMIVKLFRGFDFLIQSFSGTNRHFVTITIISYLLRCEQNVILIIFIPLKFATINKLGWKFSMRVVWCPNFLEGNKS